MSIGEQEIADFYAANRAQFNFPDRPHHPDGEVTSDRAPQPVNRTGDSAPNAQAATQKTQMMERLKPGESFSELARDYSEDPQSGNRGGDLGFVPISALRQAPAPLRDAVLKAQPGTVNVVSAPQGHTIVLLVAKEAAGQRDIEDPAVQQLDHREPAWPQGTAAAHRLPQRRPRRGRHRQLHRPSRRGITGKCPAACCRRRRARGNGGRRATAARRGLVGRPTRRVFVKRRDFHRRRCGDVSHVGYRHRR